MGNKPGVELKRAKRGKETGPAVQEDTDGVGAGGATSSADSDPAVEAGTAPVPISEPAVVASPPKLDVGSLAEPLRSLPVTYEEQAYVEEHFTSKTTGVTAEDFELLKVIGKGSFGKVMQVKKKDTHKIYAMKVLKKAQLVKRKQVAHTKTERKVLEDISNPFIVSLRFAFQTDTKLYMILDYFTGGELFFHLKNGGRFTEERARFYAAEIAIALQCLHDHEIVYRDLKPENVLLDEEGHIRLTDFGLSKENVSTTKLTHTFCGTPEYLAPEVIHGQGYGTPVDWWSLGTLLYEMLTGLPPFYNQNLHVMYEKIISGKLTFPSHLSPEARSLLTGLLERNPKLRLGTRSGLEEIKRHPFFAVYDFDKLYRKEIRPPFKPETTEGKLDTTNIDDEFKKETPKDTPVMASTLRSRVNFPNFTFAAPESALADHELNLGDSDDEDLSYGLDGSDGSGAARRIEPGALSGGAFRRTYLSPITQKDLASSSPVDHSAPLRSALGP